MKRWLLTAGLAAFPVLAAQAQPAGDAVRPLVILTQPQAASPAVASAAMIAMVVSFTARA